MSASHPNITPESLKQLTKQSLTSPIDLNINFIYQNPTSNDSTSSPQVSSSFIESDSARNRQPHKIPDLKSLKYNKSKEQQINWVKLLPGYDDTFDPSQNIPPVNLSQKDQNILVLNDDLVELEDKLKELNDKNKTINQENDKFKKLLIQNNIKF